jgi:hypothetical protein
VLGVAAQVVRLCIACNGGVIMWNLHILIYGQEWWSTVPRGSHLSGKEDAPEHGSGQNSQESYHMMQRLAEAGEGRTDDLRKEDWQPGAGVWGIAVEWSPGPFLPTNGGSERGYGLVPD